MVSRRRRWEVCGRITRVRLVSVREKWEYVTVQVWELMMCLPYTTRVSIVEFSVQLLCRKFNIEKFMHISADRGGHLLHWLAPEKFIKKSWLFGRGFKCCRGHIRIVIMNLFTLFRLSCRGYCCTAKWDSIVVVRENRWLFSNWASSIGGTISLSAKNKDGNCWTRLSDGGFVCSAGSSLIFAGSVFCCWGTKNAILSAIVVLFDEFSLTFSAFTCRSAAWFVDLCKSCLLITWHGWEQKQLFTIGAGVGGGESCFLINVLKIWTVLLRSVWEDNWFTSDISFGINWSFPFSVLRVTLFLSSADGWSALHIGPTARDLVQILYRMRSIKVLTFYKR